mmetsp:Transcript_22853/g.38176  ORF Transcript_22853/g.38176 Transcript_22853/m.38176 type:complete len:208 (-) Transcript_22853:3658-4281(-)
MKFKAFLAAAFVALSPLSSAAQDLISPEKLNELTQQISELREKLTATGTVLTTSRAQVEDLEYVIANSEAVAQKVTDDLAFIIQSLEVGSPNHASLLSVQDQLQRKANEYSESDSTVLRDTVAPRLLMRIEELNAIDARRDKIVADARDAERLLEVNVRELEGLILADASEQIVQVFTKMLDSAEGTVNEALQVGNDLAAAAGLDPQ